MHGYEYFFVISTIVDPLAVGGEVENSSRSGRREFSWLSLFKNINSTQKSSITQREGVFVLRVEISTQACRGLRKIFIRDFFIPEVRLNKRYDRFATQNTKAYSVLIVFTWFITQRIMVSLNTTNQLGYLLTKQSNK